MNLKYEPSSEPLHMSEPSTLKQVPRGLYDALGLKPSCDRSEIKKAYHRCPKP